ncbi:DUF6272 family protein [Desulfobacterales bacterium HSG2]|nr:DUF6272 family protein [Desulfobacterales bacterium HSG2]
MSEEKTVKIGDFLDPKEIMQFDLSSTLRLRARSIDQKRLWESKNRSAEFMGDIWSLFVDPEKEERIKTVLHSVCVELIENSVKYGYQDQDYTIVTDLYLKSDELLVYVINKSDQSRMPDLETSARLILGTDNIRKLFKQKMKEAKAAKKQGKSKSQLGFIQIVMQNVRLAWRIELGSESAVVTTLARIPLTEKDA